MKIKRITQISVLGIVVLIASLILMPSLVDAKNPVRPHKVSGEGTVNTLTGEAYDTGNGTHIGHFENNWDAVSGVGTITAANGDTFKWRWVENEDYTEGPSAVIYDGTGKFANVDGALNFKVSQYTEDTTTYYSYTAVGWISY